jgi:hypothetical protein
MPFKPWFERHFALYLRQKIKPRKKNAPISMPGKTAGPGEAVLLPFL